MDYQGAWWREERPESTWPIYEDFKVFLAVTWKQLNLPPPTRTQYEIADYLQHGPKRLIVEAFRGCGKSWITSAFVLWLLLRDPQLNIMVVSAAKERADQFSTFCQALMADMPLLSHLVPSSNQRCSKIAFDVAPAEPDHAPSVKSVGIMGQLTGSRADIIIADDIEVPNNSETANMREKLDARTKELEAILKPLDSSRIIMLGTPQCEESIYNTLATTGYVPRFWPSRYPTPEQAKGYGDFLAPRQVAWMSEGKVQVGEPTDTRFSDEDLMQREARYGRSMFALQFQLDTTLADADRYPLKIDDLIVDTCDRETAPDRIIWGQSDYWRDLECYGFNADRYHKPFDYERSEAGHVSRSEYQGRLMSIDPSGRGKDECAYSVVYMLHGYVYLMAAGAVQGYDEKSLTELSKIAKDHKVHEVIIESNFGDGMFSALLTPFLQKNHPVHMEEVRSSGQKEARIIDTLEPVISNHKMIVDRKVIESDYKSVQGLPIEQRRQYSLFYQLSHVTRDRGSLRKDDRLDALSIAVARFTEQMAKDAQVAAQEANTKRLEEELRNFHSHVTGSARFNHDTWASARHTLN